jgi:hypothetical protein
MQKITTSAELKEVIIKLEYEQSMKGVLLKEQFHHVIESLKPVNLIKNTFRDVTGSPFIMDNLLGSAVGLASGYLSRRVIIGTSGGIIKKILGSVLQFGVSRIVAKNPDAIKSVAQRIGNIFGRKKNLASR